MANCKHYWLRPNKHLNTLLFQILVWIISKHVFAENQINFHTENLVGSFTSSDLSIIFDDDDVNMTEENKQTFQSIFETFPRLLVPFEHVPEKARQTSPERLILEHASNINQNHNNRHLTDNMTKPLEIWMSFFPERNISSDVTTILKIASQANSIFEGTVTTILLQYQTERLSALTLPLIKQEIMKTANLIRKYPNDNLSFGVILDLKNCQQHVERIRQLPMDVVDFLFFNVDKVPQLKDQGYLSALIHLAEGYENCRKKAVEQIDLKRTSIGFISKWAVSINQTDKLSLKLENQRILKSIGDWSKGKNVTLVIEAFFLNKILRKNTTRKVTTEKGNKEDKVGIDVAWLRKPMLLNKQQIRLSLGNQSADYHTNSKFIPTLNEKFRKIFLGDITHEAEKFTIVQQLVDQISYFKGDIVRQKPGGGGGGGEYSSLEDQIPMQVLISVDVSKPNVKFNHMAIDNALSISKRGNDLYPETVNPVVLNYEDYDVDNELRILNKTDTFWSRFIGPNIIYAYQAIKMHLGETKLGIILPVRFCDLFTKSDANHSNSELEMVNVIIYKVDLSMADIKAGVYEQAELGKSRIKDYGLLVQIKD